jgi:hypothetical protein
VDRREKGLGYYGPPADGHLGIRLLAAM